MSISFLKAIITPNPVYAKASYGLSLSLSYVPDPPDPPENLTVNLGKATAILTWSEPKYDGGSKVTHYTVSISTGSRPTTTETKETTYTHTCTAGTTYTATVCAVNAYGTGKGVSVIYTA